MFARRRGGNARPSTLGNKSAGALAKRRCRSKPHPLQGAAIRSEITVRLNQPVSLVLFCLTGVERGQSTAALFPQNFTPLLVLSCAKKSFSRCLR